MEAEWKKNVKKNRGWGGGRSEESETVKSVSTLLENARCVCVCVRVLQRRSVPQTALWHGKRLLVQCRAELEACSKPFTFIASLARCSEHGWHSAMFITQRPDQRELLSGSTTFIWVPTADSSIHGGLSSPFSPALMVSFILLVLLYLYSRPLFSPHAFVAGDKETWRKNVFF